MATADKLTRDEARERIKTSFESFRSSLAYAAPELIPMHIDNLELNCLATVNQVFD